MPTEERLKQTIEKISQLGIPVTFEENEGLNEIIGKALEEQDAETEARIREECADATVEVIKNNRLVGADYIPIEVAAILSARTHAACINAEEEE